MKAISIKQPWAWIILNWQGTPNIPKKRIENRNTLKHIRGRFLLHAGLAFDMDGYRSITEWVSYHKPFDEAMEFSTALPDPYNSKIYQHQSGGIVGAFDIVDCVTESDDFWFVGENGLVLANVERLPFFKCPGRQGIFNVEYPG